MKPIRVINEFINSGFTNVDLGDVIDALNALSPSIPKGQEGEHVRKKLDDIRYSANIMWKLRTDKYWERWIEK